jgi:hypothetical protein
MREMIADFLELEDHVGIDADRFRRLFAKAFAKMDDEDRAALSGAWEREIMSAVTIINFQPSEDGSLTISGTNHQGAILRFNGDLANAMDDEHLESLIAGSLCEALQRVEKLQYPDEQARQAHVDVMALSLGYNMASVDSWVETAYL